MEFLESQLVTLFEEAPDPIWVLNQRLEVVWANGAAKKYYASDLVGQKCYRAFHQRDRSCDELTCGACLSLLSGERRESEAKVGGNTDSERWLRYSTSLPLFDEQCNDALILIIAKDISVQKRTDLLLRDSLELAQNVLAEVSDAVLITDDQGRFSFVCPNVASVLGLSSATVWTQKTITGLFGKEFFDLAELQRSGEIRNLEIAWLNSSSEERRLRLQIKAVGKGCFSVLCLCQDVTELSRLQKIVEEKDRMKAIFIATAGHELRTPLTAVQGFAELLLDQPAMGEQEQRECLQAIYQGAQKLSTIVDNLMLLAQAMSGEPICTNKSWVDIKPLIIPLVKELEQQTTKHQFQLRLPENPVFTYWDVPRMGQVFENLLSNAIKYAPAGGSIVIDVQEIEKGLSFSVQDHGIGMSPEVQSRIFDKFFKADGSESGSSGLGLGMSVTKRIVEEHGGHIWVESSPGRGTTVIFTLPIDSREVKHTVQYASKKRNENVLC